MTRTSAGPTRSEPQTPTDSFDAVVGLFRPMRFDLAATADTAKCAASAPYGQDERRIFMLVPASVGASWFAEHVHEKALVLALAPRLQFVGQARPSAKDSLLCVYGEHPGFQTWRWRSSKAPVALAQALGGKSVATAGGRRAAS